MASTKIFLVLLLVALVTLDSANCYFRLGREMDGRSADKSNVVKNVERMVTQRVLRKVAKCIMQVCMFYNISFSKEFRNDKNFKWTLSYMDIFKPLTIP